MTEILPPTRSQLAEFINNHETIRRFELLFRMVGEDLPDAITNNGESALSVANSALALISELAQSVVSDLAVLEAKSNSATDEIHRHGRDIEILRFYSHAIQTS